MVNMDLNKDGKVDKKDKIIAAKVLATKIQNKIIKCERCGSNTEKIGNTIYQCIKCEHKIFEVN